METKLKGDLAEIAVMKECMRRGYKVAIPYGDDWRYDLLVLRDDGSFAGFDRVQVKYAESDGEVIRVRCSSRSGSRSELREKRYTSDEIDWLAVYDRTYDRCYFIPAHKLEGRSEIFLRLTPTKSGMESAVTWAEDFVTF